MISEETSLDIRGEYKQYPSNLRCSIIGIDNIKKYCREESLEEIEEVEDEIEETKFKSTLFKTK